MKVSRRERVVRSSSSKSEFWISVVGASILIILGVSLAIGLVVLLFGLYYMKRSQRRLHHHLMLTDN